MNQDSTRHTLTLDQPVTYEIIVTGRLGEEWSDWVDPAVGIDLCGTGDRNTRIVGVFDQAGLHGLLRRLYSVGYPLISARVITVTGSPKE